VTTLYADIFWNLHPLESCFFCRKTKTDGNVHRHRSSNSSLDYSKDNLGLEKKNLNLTSANYLLLFVHLRSYLRIAKVLAEVIIVSAWLRTLTESWKPPKIQAHVYPMYLLRYLGSFQMKIWFKKICLFYLWNTFASTRANFSLETNFWKLTLC
jgi:hypothetical protein